MITDRKKFFFRYPGSVVKRVEWLRKGERRIASRPNNSQAVNMYAGITKHGVTKPHLVTGTSKMATTFKNMKGIAARNITSQEYETVCLETLPQKVTDCFVMLALNLGLFSRTMIQHIRRPPAEL